MVRALSTIMGVAWLALAAGCASKDPLFCDEQTPCGAGQTCNLATRTCRPIAADAGPDAALREAGLQDGADRGTNTGDLGEKLPLAASCQTGSQCKSGFCVDDVCCDGACTETCRSCALAGSAGQCKNVPEGQDPRRSCPGTSASCGGSCDGKGACSFLASKGKECAPPVCAAATLTLSSCDDKGACATSPLGCGGYTCDAGGAKCKTTCSAPSDCTGTAQCLSNKCVSNLGLGETCGTNNDACASKNCVDGVCCDGACMGKCMRCDLAASKGKCSPILATQDPDKECPGKDAACGGACNGAGACTFPAGKGCPGKDPSCTGSCDAVGACSYAAIVGKQCQGPSCSGATKSTFACDAASTCAKSSAACPNLLTCNAAGSDCLTSCTAHTHCTTSFCDLFGFPHGAARKSTCVTAADLCTVSTSVAGAFQACLDSQKKYVAVPNGTFPENLIAKAAVQIVGTGMTGAVLASPLATPVAPGAKVRPSDANKAALDLAFNAALVYGLEVFHATKGSASLIQHDGSVQVRSCYVHTANSNGVRVYPTGDLLLNDVAISDVMYGVAAGGALSLEKVSIGSTSTMGLHVGGATLTARDLAVAFNLGGGIKTYAAVAVDIDRAFVGVNLGGPGLDFVMGTTGKVWNAQINANGQEGIKLAGPGLGFASVGFANLTVADNGGVEVACNTIPQPAGTYPPYGHDAFVNTIVWDKNNTQSYTGKCVFYNSNVRGGAGIWGANNLDADPVFSGASGASYYDLLPASPCINKGDGTVAGLPTTDILGRPRVAKGAVDIGAFEVQ